MGTKKIFITGVSSGFGRALAEEAMASGHRVAGSVRNATAKAEFEKVAAGRGQAVLLDVTDDVAVERVVAAVDQEIGGIDVLVNNAGYGHEGILEESPLQDLRQQFAVNVFGAVAVIKAVLPGMRQRRAGHIINITSMGGLTTFPGLSYYHGSKFALEGISETLAKELAPLGIAVTAVEPGGFRTDWAGRSMVRAGRSIRDYDASFDAQRAARRARDGNQPGDPRRAAEAMLKIMALPRPPVHLLLGNDAIHFVREKLRALEAEINEWEPLTRSTDFA